MISSALILIAATSSQSAPVPDISAATVGAVRDYRTCVSRAAKRLDRSAAEVESVVKASLTACSGKREEAWAALQADFIIAEVERGKRSTPRRADRLLNGIDKQAADEARLALLQGRAAQKKN